MKPEEVKLMADTMWVLFTAFLVFWMNAGFALVESGFSRAKNCANILAKNFIVFCITTLAYWLVGFAFMFGDGNKFIGWNTEALMLLGAHNAPEVLTKGVEYKGVYSSLSWTYVPLYAAFFFQLVFAATAATIVSGAVAERIKYHAFIIFSFLMATIIYPVTGHWIWGGGVLSGKMFDFAGSTVVHSVGGWAALAGAIMLGPRLGKYGPGGKVNPIPGHNMTSATLGVFILWLGWFGFNPGSTMAADPEAISRIALTTNIACAASGFISAIWAWLRLGKPDLSMMLNGGLAGLVAITCPCNWVDPLGAAIIGAVAGVLVVESVLFFDRIKVDDPVGAISVHLTNGIWGTLALGLFASTGGAGTEGQPGLGIFYGGSFQQLRWQLIGVALVGVYVFFVSLVSWGLIKAIVGLRVSEEEEIEGLDIGEMGMEAYASDPFGSFEALQIAGWERVVPTIAHEPRPALRQTASPMPPTSGSSPVAVPPPAPETATPAIQTRQGYKVVIENANREAIRRRWEMLCRGTTSDIPPEFAEVYGNLTSFEDSTFVFYRGEPERMRQCVERIIQGYGGAGTTVRVEMMS